MNPLIPLVLNFAGWLVPVGALLLVQSTLLLGAGLIVAQLCRRQGPAVESFVLRTTLVAAVLCPVFSLSLGRMGIAGWRLTLPGGDRLAPMAAPASAVAMATPAGATAAPSVVAPASLPVAGTTVPANAAQSAKTVQLGTPPSADSPASGEGRPTSSVGTIYTVTATLWLVGGLFWLLRLAVCHGRIARLRREADLADVTVFENCNAIAQQLSITPPEVRVHTGIKSPLLVGVFRPAILLPDVKGLEEVVATREVLVHELAHRARSDCLWHLLSRIATAVLWIQPLAWLLARRIEETAEDVCDNYVIEHARDRRGYAQQLVALAEQLQFSPTEALAGTGVIAFRSALGQRVVRILDASRNLSFRVPRGALTGTTAILTLATGAVSLVGVADAQPDKAARIFNSDGPTVKTLITGTGYDAGGILSPDESMVAYVDWGGSGGDGVVRDLRTGKMRNLTASTRRADYEYLTGGCWAFDSQTLAYGWSVSGSNDSVRTISRDGGAPKVIRESKDDSFSPQDWSRDGKLLVGKSSRRTRPISAVATLEIATGELHELEPQIGGTEHLRFSPDGRFITGSFLNGKIFVVGVQGGEPMRLTDSSAQESCPVFSADGRHVLFSSNRRGSWDLWSVGFENGRTTDAPVLVKYDFGDYDKWTTTTGKLAFTIRAAQSGVFAVGADGRSTPAQEPKEISKSFLGSHLSPAWSPDGKKIAYVRVGKPPVVCVQSLDDGHEETFNTGLWDIQFIFWSQDNQTLALRGAGKDNTRGVFLFSLESRKPVTAPLAANGKVYAEGKTFPLGFSSDGTEFGFMVWDGKQRERVALALKTGVERTVTTAGDRAWIEASRDAGFPLINYHVSQDAAVAGIEEVGKENRIVVADSANRNRRIVARAPAPAELGAPRWSPDGTKVAYYLWPEDSSVRKYLHVCAADGSWDRIVNTGQLYIKGGARAPTWSADSAKLAVTLNSDIPSQIGVLENFLPKEALAAK